MRHDKGLSGKPYQCAFNQNLDYIVSRDPKGFENSKVRFLSPEAFLEMLERK